MIRLPDHRILVSGYIGLTRTAKVEYQCHIGLGLRLVEISGQQSPDVFRQRHAEFAGALAGAAMSVTFQRDLGSCHHDGTIITYEQSPCTTTVKRKKLSSYTTPAVSCFSFSA